MAHTELYKSRGMQTNCFSLGLPTILDLCLSSHHHQLPSSRLALSFSRGAAAFLLVDAHLEGSKNESVRGSRAHWLLRWTSAFCISARRKAAPAHCCSVGNTTDTKSAVTLPHPGVEIEAMG